MDVGVQLRMEENDAILHMIRDLAARRLHWERLSKRKITGQKKTTSMEKMANKTNKSYFSANSRMENDGVSDAWLWTPHQTQFSVPVVLGNSNK